jgi:hypothetical protein
MKIKLIAPLLAGLGLLCACGGRKLSETTDTTSTLSSVKVERATSKADTIQISSKEIKKADIRFKVKDVQQTAERITALTASLNGTVVHHFIHSTTGDSVNIQKSKDSLLRVTVINTSAGMTVKIPPGNMESFMVQVAKLGIYTNNSYMDIGDKSLEYLATRLKLKNQRDLLKQRKSDSTAKDPDNLLAFKNNMVDQQIGNRRIDDSVKNSVITLNFYQSSFVNRELVANVDLTAYQLPFFTRIGISLDNGWRLFVDVIVALANIGVLVPIAAAIWIVARYYNRKKKPAELVKS